ncbi:tyrosine-protein phosphatase, partial [Anaerolineae bacterium CFX9]|nr:tyrosine-protein phosphatase [Anaerolineae bacterium CFX9]
MTHSSVFSRHIMLEGAYNVRDLGGLSTSYGETRRGVIFRADALHQLTEADQQVLRDKGVRTVIDLRHSTEIDAQPNVFANDETIRYFKIPIFRAAVSGHSEGHTPDLPAIYRYIIDECRISINEVLTTIADAKTGGVLFHCTAGKDRTGIITALLLDMVGVD